MQADFVIQVAVVGDDSSLYIPAVFLFLLSMHFGCNGYRERERERNTEGGRGKERETAFVKEIFDLVFNLN